MLVNRTLFIIFTVVLMLILSFLMKNIILAGIITFFIVMIAYLIISIFRGKKRINLLEENCDPEAFLEATEKQRKITGKNPKMNSYFDIDKSAGLILLGQFQEAKEVLLSIDQNLLSNKNGTLLIYTINLIACLHELGEIEESEKIYENQIPLLSPINKRLVLSMNFLIADRLFFLGRLDESKENFNELLKQKVSKRIYLSVLYRLAQIEEKTGNTEDARSKYKEVADKGNNLWIAKQTKKH
ncbi:MAG: tol-pal system YbgF family protein [Clostridiaceae bacterium]